MHATFMVMGAHAVILPMLIFAFMPISGAHFNPMVTFAMVAAGRQVCSRMSPCMHMSVYMQWLIVLLVCRVRSCTQKVAVLTLCFAPGSSSSADRLSALEHRHLLPVIAQHIIAMRRSAYLLCIIEQCELLNGDLLLLADSDQRPQLSCRTMHWRYCGSIHSLFCAAQYVLAPALALPVLEEA